MTIDVTKFHRLGKAARELEEALHDIEGDMPAKGDFVSARAGAVYSQFGGTKWRPAGCEVAEGRVSELSHYYVEGRGIEQGMVLDPPQGQPQLVLFVDLITLSILRGEPCLKAGG